MTISSSSSENVHTETSARHIRPPAKSPTDDDDGTKPMLAVNESNVALVLEKLLAMMQSMSMLLSALKNDFRYPRGAQTVARKQEAAVLQLWRAFRSYQKSFTDIEQFASSSVAGRGQRSPNVGVAEKRSRRTAGGGTADVIEVSESEDDEDDDDGGKRRRCDQRPISVSSAAASELSNAPVCVTSSADSSLVLSASNVSLEEAESDASSSCVCVDPAGGSPLENVDADCQ